MWVEGCLCISKKISVALRFLEWLRSDPRRTAVGLDLDLEALQWCLENNVNKVGADGYSRISLFHGNVLKPHEAKLVSFKPQELIRNIQLEESDGNSKITAIEPNMHEGSTASSNEESIKADSKIPARDIYTWEQAEFDIIGRKTRISLHFHLQKQQKKLRHAFSYSWRLWSLPEIKDCLEEAGFLFVHFWLQKMPDTTESRSTAYRGIWHWARSEV